MARETVATAEVKPGEKISRGINSTGQVLHLPGGSGGYPAFWIRDAAMMLGGGLISAPEIEGWIRVVAAVQPGPQGINLQRGLAGVERGALELMHVCNASALQQMQLLRLPAAVSFAAGFAHESQSLGDPRRILAIIEEDLQRQVAISAMKPLPVISVAESVRRLASRWSRSKPVKPRWTTGGAANGALK